jgi:hypothetical protein
MVSMHNSKKDPLLLGKSESGPLKDTKVLDQINAEHLK